MKKLNKIGDKIKGKRKIQIFTLILELLLQRINNLFYQVYNKLLFFMWGVYSNSSIRTYGFLRIHNDGKFVIGRKVRIISGQRNFVGGSQKTSFWIGRKSYLNIGEGCAISNSTFVCLDRITIGKDVFIGGGCKIYDTDFHSLDINDRISGVIGKCAPVTINNNVFIGGHTIILKGVSIGENSIIGAGSIVTKNVPNNELWAGVPAKFKKYLN